MKCCEIWFCADMGEMKGSYLWRVNVDCLERNKDICSKTFYAHFNCNAITIKQIQSTGKGNYSLQTFPVHSTFFKSRLSFHVLDKHMTNTLTYHAVFDLTVILWNRWRDLPFNKQTVRGSGDTELWPGHLHWGNVIIMKHPNVKRMCKESDFFFFF